MNDELAAAHLSPLAPEVVAKFAAYLDLLVRWNARINLTSIRQPADIVRRHFVESIACAEHLPPGITSLLDLGSGAGFPGIPIALRRPEIRVTLAESQNKKAAFLREAVRITGANAVVFGKRAEELAERFDCVALRAVEEMPAAMALAGRLLHPLGWIAVMTSVAEVPKVQEVLATRFDFGGPILLPGSISRVLLLCRGVGSEIGGLEAVV